MLNKSRFLLLLHAFFVFVLDRTKCRADGSDDVKYIERPSTDFQGNEIINAALTNATINGNLQHLAVHTLEIQSERADLAAGTRLAVIDHRGALSTTPHAKWDETKKSLSMEGLSSASGTIVIHSDVDLQGRTIRNIHMEQNSILSNIIFERGVIRDSTLSNVSFENLTLGDIQVDQIHISSLENDPQTNALLIAGDDGRIKKSNAIHEKDGGLVITDSVHFEVPLHLKENVKAREIEVDNLVLSPYLNSKRHITDVLLSIDANGVLQSSNLTMEDGWIEHAKFAGDIIFGDESNKRKPGKIINAKMEGGSISDVEELSVIGEVHCKSGLRVHEDVFIDGSLSVGGSVLGSGPYVDVSDARLKKNILSISNDDIVEKLNKLKAVSYDLKNGGNESSSALRSDGSGRPHHNNRQQIGFIAQEVREVFPELVSERLDGYLGIQYSRFVPLLNEAMKDIDKRIRKLEEENHMLKRMVQDLLK